MTTDRIGPATRVTGSLGLAFAAIRSMRVRLRRPIHVSELSPHLLRDIGLDAFDVHAAPDRDKSR